VAAAGGAGGRGWAARRAGRRTGTGWRRAAVGNGRQEAAAGATEESERHGVRETERRKESGEPF
jgi:hypothetical protein